jgi:hypothetical protein
MQHEPLGADVDAVLLLCVYDAVCYSMIFLAVDLLYFLCINDDGVELMIVYVVMFVAVWLVNYRLVVFFKHKNCDGYDYV